MVRIIQKIGFYIRDIFFSLCIFKMISKVHTRRRNL